MINNHITMHLHADKLKLGRYALQLWFPGEMRRYV